MQRYNSFNKTSAFQRKNTVHFKSANYRQRSILLIRHKLKTLISTNSWALIADASES